MAEDTEEKKKKDEEEEKKRKSEKPSGTTPDTWSPPTESQRNAAKAADESAQRVDWAQHMDTPVNQDYTADTEDKGFEAGKDYSDPYHDLPQGLALTQDPHRYATARKNMRASYHEPTQDEKDYEETKAARNKKLFGNGKKDEKVEEAKPEVKAEEPKAITLPTQEIAAPYPTHQYTGDMPAAQDPNAVHPYTGNPGGKPNPPGPNLQQQLGSAFGSAYKPPPSPMQMPNVQLGYKPPTGMPNQPVPDQSLAAPQGAPPVAMSTLPTYTTPGPNGQPIGGPPEGSLTATPHQAAAGMLNNNEQEQALVGKEGDIMSQSGQDQAALEQQKANEDNQHALDYKSTFDKLNTQYEQEHAQAKADVDKYREQVGKLDSPEKGYWAEHGTASKILSAFAAFAGGMGAGLLGKAGNPYMDFLQKQIDGNFQAHKANIQAMYDKQVASGKLADTTENHNAFIMKAKLVGYNLDSAHITSELEKIKNQTTGNVQKSLADRTINDLDKTRIQLQQQVAANDAARAAAALASQRAMQEKVRSTYKDLYEKNLAAGFGTEEAGKAAAQGIEAMGYPRSAIDSMATSHGGIYNPKSGKYDYPQAEENKISEPGYDSKGNIAVPTKDVNGKPFKPEEQAKMQEDVRERTVMIDGRPHLAINKEAGKALREFNEAEPFARKRTEELIKAWKEGDAGAYNQARESLIELAPKLYGFTRAPSLTQAGEGRNTDEGVGTVGGQIPIFSGKMGLFNNVPEPQFMVKFEHEHPGFANTATGQAISKLNGWKQSLDDLKKQSRSNNLLIPPPEPATKEEADKAQIKKIEGLGGTHIGKL